MLFYNKRYTPRERKKESVNGVNFQCKTNHEQLEILMITTKQNQQQNPKCK